jgi:hypothetical protein
MLTVFCNLLTGKIHLKAFEMGQKWDLWKTNIKTIILNNNDLKLVEENSLLKFFFLQKGHVYVYSEWQNEPAPFCLYLSTYCKTAIYVW